MKFKTLCLVITDRCTAACDFCGFSCGPDRSQVMDVNLMTRLIHEAKAMGMETVGFSGGEPFLYPELLAEGARVAREEKMGIKIATNGFWGAWDDDKIKEALEKIKPDAIDFSYDFFHRKFVPEDSIKRAISASLSLDIEPSLYIADMKGEYSAGRFIQSMDNERYAIRINIYPLFRCGRALNMPKEWFFTSNAATKENLGCLYANLLSVLYNGDVYPCCRHEVFESAMKMGNVQDKSLGAVLEASNVPMICDVLMQNDRFRSLLAQAKEMGLEISDEAGCSCDYCRMLFGTEERKQKMLPHVEALYGEMMVRSLMKGVQKNVP